MSARVQFSNLSSDTAPTHLPSTTPFAPMKNVTGKTDDSVIHGYPALRVPTIWKGEAELVDILCSVPLRILYIHSHKQDAGVLVLLPYPLEAGGLVAARGTPRSPEVYYHGLSGIIFQVEFAPIQKSHREWRRGLSDSGHSTASGSGLLVRESEREQREECNNQNGKQHGRDEFPVFPHLTLLCSSASPGEPAFRLERRFARFGLACIHSFEGTGKPPRTTQLPPR